MPFIPVAIIEITKYIRELIKTILLLPIEVKTNSSNTIIIIVNYYFNLIDSLINIKIELMKQIMKFYKDINANYMRQKINKPDGMKYIGRRFPKNG